MSKDHRAPPMTNRRHTQWFHGSPERLKSLRTGSTITPVLAFAKAMSHKPSELAVEIRDNSDAGERRVVFRHNGTRPGYLYKVLIEDPSRDLEQHPESSGAVGEEVLTTRKLDVEFLETLSVCPTYEFSEPLDENAPP